jgi:hypothetical protein
MVKTMIVFYPQIFSFGNLFFIMPHVPEEHLVGSPSNVNCTGVPAERFVLSGPEACRNCP